MNSDMFREIKPKGKPFKRIYIAVMLWIVGRAIQAAAKVDRAVKQEFDGLRDDFAVRLWVAPSGPAMVICKDKKGRVKYVGGKLKSGTLTLDMKIKNIEAAMRVFTFRESTCQAFCNDRFIVSGDLPDALAFVRVLNLIEVFLLPEFIASLAVKRYPDRSELGLSRKYIGRALVYIRAFTF